MADFQYQRSEDASCAIAEHVLRNHGSLTPEAKADVVRFFTGYVKSAAAADAPMSSVKVRRARQRLWDAAERVCVLIESPLEFADLEPIASQTGAGSGRACFTLYNGEEVEVAGDELRPFCRHVYSSPCLLVDTRGGRCAFVDRSDSRKVWVVNPEKFNQRFAASGKRIPPSQITYQQLRARGMSHMQALKWMKANGATALPPPVVPKSTDYVYNAAGGGSIELTEAQLRAIGDEGVVGRSVGELARVDPMLIVALDFYSMGLFPAHRIYQLFPGALVFFPRKIKDKNTRVYAVDQQAYEAASARAPGTYPGVAGPVERAFNLFRGLGYNDDFSRAYARAFPGITPQDFQAMRSALRADPTMPISDVVAAASASGAISSKLGSAPDVYCDLGLRHVGEEIQRPPTTPAAPPRTAMAELKKVVAQLGGACSRESNLRVLGKLDELNGSASLVTIWPSLPGSDLAKVKMTPGNTLPVTPDLIEKLRGLAWAADAVGPRRRYLYPCTAMLLIREVGEERESMRDDDIALYMTSKEYNSAFSDTLGLKMTDEQCVLSTYYAFWASPQFMGTVDAGSMVKFYSKSGTFDAVAMKSLFLKEAIGAMETVLGTPGADILKSGFDAALGVEDLVSIVKAYKTGALKSLSTYDPTDKMECPTKPRIGFPPGSGTKRVVSPPAFDKDPAKDAPAPAQKKPSVVDTGVEPAPAEEPAKVAPAPAQKPPVVDTGVGRDALLALNDIARELRNEKIKPGEANTRSARSLGGLVMKRYDPRAPEKFDVSKPVSAVKLKPVLEAPEAEGADLGPSFAAKGHWWRYPGLIMIVVREPSHSRGPLKDRELAFFVPMEAYNKHLASQFGYTADIKDVIVSAASAFMLPLNNLGSPEDLAARFRTPTGHDTRGMLGHIANAARAYLVRERARLEAVRDKASVKSELARVRIMLGRFDRGEIAAVVYDAVAKKPHSQPRDSSTKGKGAFSRLRRTLGLTTPKVSGRGQAPSATATPAAAPPDKKKSGLFSRLRGFARRFVRESIGAPVGARCLVSDDVDAVIALVAACGLEADAMVTELRDR